MQQYILLFSFPTNSEFLTGVGIDVPFWGFWTSHHQTKYLLEICNCTSPKTPCNIDAIPQHCGSEQRELSASELAKLNGNLSCCSSGISLLKPENTKLYPLFSWVMWNRTGHLPRPVYTGFAEHRVTSKNWCWNHIKNFLPYLETMFHTWEEITPCLMVTKHTWPFDGEPSWKAVGPSSSMIREMVSPGSPTRDKNTWY